MLIYSDQTLDEAIEIQRQTGHELYFSVRKKGCKQIITVQSGEYSS